MDEKEQIEFGVKHDKEKTRLELLSSSWLFGVGDVLTFGARKYAAHNWRKGIALSRLLGAALRHIFAFIGGENYDPESGLHHLCHASCCLMFASELHETHPELDDRYKFNTRTIEEDPRKQQVILEPWVCPKHGTFNKEAGLKFTRCPRDGCGNVLYRS